MFRTAHGYSQSAKRRKGAKFDDLNGVDGQTGGEEGPRARYVASLEAFFLCAVATASPPPTAL